MGKGYDKKVKLTRIFLRDYLELKILSQATGISMAEALHKLIEHQQQLPLIPDFFKPKFIEGNGAATFKPKFIESDEDNHVKLKSIR